MDGSCARVFTPPGLAQNREVVLLGWTLGQRLRKSRFPITWLPLHVHDSHHPNSVRLVHIDDRVREPSTEVPPGRRIEQAIALGILTHLVDQTLHLSVKPDSKIRIDLPVITDCLGKFSICARMKSVVLHRPAIFRIRANDSSTGIPSTSPFWIWLIRRLTSSFHCCSTAGSSPPCLATRIRSTNSATMSGGSCRVSSTI
jgi:hypothetical protein